jgi:uncharacterized tellurite resistance protein B-like protein|tara:strand:- start:644 stop:1072 length:429 start_codon:yes stop_codon:yes gene_type:complete
MISFFKKKEKNHASHNRSYLKIAALLIHAAKIDETYEENEKKIIKKTLIELGVQNSSVDDLVLEATVIEENSNQILDFTKEIKNVAGSEKNKIIEALWKIIYSNNNADMYETNLMRRLAGLLYIDPKTMGDLKEKVKKELEK